MLLVFFIGILSLAYPFVSDTLNDYLDQQIIKNYQKKAKSEHASVIAELNKQMREANEKKWHQMNLRQKQTHFPRKKRKIRTR